MGLFDFLKKDKEAETCPLCGEVLGVFNSRALGDGTSICSKCAGELRTEFPVEEREELDEFGNTEYNSRGFVKTYMYDSLSKATLEDVKRVKNEHECSSAKANAELGGSYENMFIVSGDTFSIAPKPLEVGLIRAKQLKYKLVVEGFVQSGTFSKGDLAVLFHDGQKKEIKILEVHKKEVSGFSVTIAANMSKSAKSGESAWMILDLDDGVGKGDTIVK